ncbi:MAG TPA: hypothetical protein VHN80_05480 [Kineosporiaceae bacterium]|nr:hypothetical protein [Kineosporiaceae bacterium]
MAGRQAGLPAIVWARTATDPAMFRRVVDEELLAEGPADLPRQVWRYRLRHPAAIQADPEADDEHPPLGLVFGEATHIPHQLRRTHRFRAPGSGQGPEGSRQ